MRRRLLLTAAIAVVSLVSARETRAQADQYVGQRVAEVRIEVSGRPADDPQARELIEVAVGQPLAMRAVRASIQHLFNLGRFRDIVVDAAAGEQGLVVTFKLAPEQRIVSVDLRGTLGLSARRLRQIATQRLGQTPRAARARIAADGVREILRQAGFLRASVEPSIVPIDDERAAIVFDVNAGPRAQVGQVTVEGDLGQSLLTSLHLVSGSEWSEAELRRRSERALERLRGDGYYEAALDWRTSSPDEGLHVDVTLVATRGPRVQLVFEGDSIPEARQEELVPIERERSVDEDLLEDSKRRTERWLAAQGYWRAQVDYQRQQVADGQRIVFTIRKGQPAVVSEVAIEGNQSVPREELLPLLRLTPGVPFQQDLLIGDVSALTAQYHARGFADVRVDGTLIRSTAAVPSNSNVEGAVSVMPRYRIEEGPETRVGSIAIEGGSTLGESTIRQAMSLAPGGPFATAGLRSDRAAVLAAYGSRGFLEAAVTTTLTLSPDRRLADIKYTIAEGPRSTVDRVIVVGNERISASTILNELRLGPGEPVSPEALAESQRRLSALGLFRRVRVTSRPEPGAPTRDVIVEVDESPPTTVSYGGGIEAGRRLERVDDPEAPAEERIAIAPRGFFEITRRNLWGKHRSITLYLRGSLYPREQNAEGTTGGVFSFSEYRVVGSYREPRAFNWDVDAFVTGVAEQVVRASFNYRRQAANATLTRRFSRVTANARYSFGRVDVYDERYSPEDQPLIDRLFPQVRLSIVSGGLIRDSRDDILSPTRGTMTSVDGDLAARSIGSEVGFAKTLIQGFVYRLVPGTARVVFAGGARLGLATGFEREVEETGPDGEPIVTVVKDLPASERFYAGGDNTVRGFAQDRLGAPGTIDVDGFPTGGNGLLIFNGELRFPVTRNFGGVAFVDAGNVFLKASEMDISEIRGTAGLGMRYRSPIGPLRVDVGFKMTREVLPNGVRERPFVVHVSLGQAF